MFERLTDRFQDIFKNLSGKGKLTEANISESMAEVRRALLEADVNYNIAKKLVASIKEECLGSKVLKSISPGQQVVKIVNDKLTELLGDKQAEIDLSEKPTVIMLCGLHGSGKTTTAAKLALHLKNRHKRKVLLAAGDLYRPAAIHQLEVLGKDLGVAVYSDHNTKDVAKLAMSARNHAIQEGYDTLIIDTAGRLQIDTELVNELIEIKRRAKPSEILLVGDSALGQEAVSVAEHFDKALNIDGIILTKMDGDARGGAALSMRQVTGKPIKFVGIGEMPTDLEPFYPDRMASRILGMGDVVSLVERAAEQFEEEEAKKLESRLRKNQFDFDDFLDQIKRIQKMGPLGSLLKMIPGMGNLGKMSELIDENHFKKIEGIICSMTKYERQNPDKIDTSRKRRISKGSGTDLQALNNLLGQFGMMKKMLAKMNKGGIGNMFGGGGGIPSMEDIMGGGAGGGAGGGMPGMPQMPGIGKFSTASKNTPKKKVRKKIAKKNAKKKKKKKKK